MNEFGRLVNESYLLFKADKLEQCHEKLAVAFELGWEDGLKVKDNLSGTVLVALKMWFRTQPQIDSIDELVHVPLTTS